MVTWTVIRKHYAALLHDSGLSQAEVARRGGLKRNNAISRLIVNAKRGPSVATLMKAVDGLGLSLADFFAGLEDSPSAARSLSARVDAIEGAVATLLQRDPPAGAAHSGRLHDPTAPDLVLRSPTGEALGTLTFFDGPLDPIAARDDEIVRRVTAAVHATLDPLIHDLAAKVDAAVSARRDADLDAARHLPDRRGALRRPAPPGRPPHLDKTLKEPQEARG
jgi:transcriptional regulator with XRE-family HTH domain